MSQPKLSDARAEAAADVQAILAHQPVVLAFADGSVLLAKVTGHVDEEHVSACFDWHKATASGGISGGAMLCQIKRGQLARAAHEYAAAVGRRNEDLRMVLAGLRDDGRVPECALLSSPRWRGLLDHVFDVLAVEDGGRYRETGRLTEQGQAVLGYLEAKPAT